MTDWLGRQIGKYEIKELLGRGGMGAVYKAFHPALERNVAIKLIHTHMASEPSTVDRFRREAKVVAALRHPGIVQIHDFDVEVDTFYMVMEFVPGQNLRERLAAIHARGERMPLDEALVLFRSIAQAVAYAHNQGVVHRDLKPANVLLTTDGQPVLADFGLSKIISSEQLTAQGMIMGTPQYMSPEQGSGRESDPRTDVYALGIMLYEVMTGSVPFTGDSPVGILLRHAHELPAPPRSINPDLPQAVEHIIQKAVAKAPSERFASAQEFLEALEAVMLRTDIAIETVLSFTDDGRCPYRGLQTFEAEHAEFFFGREALIEQFVGQVADLVLPGEERGEKGEGRFLAVLGASGSGKSSVVRAGLVPTLQSGAIPSSDQWTSLIMKPGSRPLEELAAQLAPVLYSEAERLTATRQLVDNLSADGRALHLAVRLAWAENSAEQRLLLVIDQFEEIFTLCHDETERHRFIENLLYATSSQGRVIVLLTMRADFYHRCAVYRDLAGRISSQQVLVGPMNEAELQRAIERPARQVGLHFEPGLVDTILADVAQQPGALPLLQHALLELWGRRERGTLTLQAYRASGGVTGAIAQRAEALYADFNSEEQAIVRRVMLRLTQPGEGTEDTRRRARMSEFANLRMANGDSSDSQLPITNHQSPITTVIHRMADARLLITTRDAASGEEMVDVAHEALIRGWERLRNWIDEDRTALRTHRRLTEAAAEWERNLRDESYLYRGVRLAEAEAWREMHGDDPNELEHLFISASIAARDAVEMAAQQTRQRVITALTVGLSLVSLLLLISLGLGGAATWQWRSADLARATAQAESNRAIKAENVAATEQVKAERQSRISLAQSLAALAPRIVERTQDTELATLLALEAENLNRDEDGPIQELVDSSLRDILQEPYFRTTYRGHVAGITSIAFSPDGTTLVSSGYDGIINSWDLSNPGTGPEMLNRSLDFVNAVVSGNGLESVDALAYSPDGNTLVVAKWATILVWDLTSPNTRPIELTSQGGRVRALAFNPDGTTLATGTTSGVINLWDLANLEAEPVSLVGHEADINSVAFSVDGLVLASGGRDGIRLWDLTDLEAEPVLLDAHEKAFGRVAFSPDGVTLAATISNTIQLWNYHDLEIEPTILDRPDYHANLIAFSPDGAILASSYSSSEFIYLWDMGNPESEPIQLSGYALGVSAMVFSPDGKALATGGGPIIHLWDLTKNEVAPVILDEHENAVRAVALNPDGTYLASSSWDDTIRLWGLTKPEASSVVLSDSEEWSSTLAFSPDGQLLASANGDFTGIQSVDPTIRLWNVTDLNSDPIILSGHETGVMDVAFSPDGQRLASAGLDETVRVWDITNPEREPLVLEGHDGNVMAVAFSPDGNILASGGEDSTVRLYDMTDGGTNTEVLQGHFGSVNTVAFSPDGNILASGAQDSVIRLWDVTASGENIGVLRGHSSPITAVAFSPNGITLVSSSGDETLRVWNTAKPRMPPVVLSGHQSQINDVIFSSDGKHIASASSDGTARMWLAKTDALVEIACQKVHRNLSLFEWRQYLPNEPYRQTCPNLPPGQ